MDYTWRTDIAAGKQSFNDQFSMQVKDIANKVTLTREIILIQPLVHIKLKGRDVINAS